MPFDIYNKEFQNWLKGVFGLNTGRTALCECILDKLDNVLNDIPDEELNQYFLCLQANNISLLNTKSKGSKDKRWECEHKSCGDLMRFFIVNHKEEHKLKYKWALLEKSESNDTAGVGYHCKELKWNVIKLYMHIEKEDVIKQYTSLDCLDITHVIKIMRNCKFISTNDLDEPLVEVLASRNKFMHSPDNKMSESETCSSIQCSRKLLDCLDIAGKTYYKNAVQELQNLSDNDFVLRYQSEECKRILADVLDAKHLADELYSAIKDDNQEAKSRSKRLQDMLESIAGLRCTTNTRLEMKIAEYKRISKEFLEKKIDAIKLDQMECDRNSAEYKKMVDLKERTERAVKEVVEQMNKLEPDEMFDEIERLRKEKEYNAEVEGTLRPADKFNAEEDARILKNAMSLGFFTYQTAIDRLACVTNSQRQDIVKSFQQVYGKDLIIELNRLLFNQYKDLIDGLMMLPEEFDAYELKTAIHTRKDRDEDTMIEILCSRNNAQIQKINEAYRRMYRQELENDITGRMKGNLDQLLVSLAKGGRMEKQAVDMDEAYSDAQFLYKAREKGWRSDESQLNMIMASRSYEQLKAVFDVYCKTYGRNIETDIKSGMLPIIKCVRNRPGYFAEKIYKSIMNIDYFCLLQSGTVDDGTLIRVMVTRAEVDMVQIKQEFQKMYGQSFEQFVMKHREKTDTERKESKAHLVNSTMHFENKLEKQVAILDLTISLAEHRYV